MGVIVDNVKKTRQEIHLENGILRGEIASMRLMEEELRSKLAIAEGALEKVGQLKELATQYMVQGNTEQGMLRSYKKSADKCDTLKTGEMLMDVHDSSKEALSKIRGERG